MLDMLVKFSPVTSLCSRRSVVRIIDSCSGRWFSTVFDKASVPSCTQTKWTRRGRRSLRMSSGRCVTAFERHSNSSSSSSSLIRQAPRSAARHTQVSYTTPR